MSFFVYVTGAGDDFNGILGSRQDDHAEPFVARSARKEDRGDRERVRGGEKLINILYILCLDSSKEIGSKSRPKRSCYEVVNGAFFPYFCASHSRSLMSVLMHLFSVS